MFKYEIFLSENYRNFIKKISGGASGLVDFKNGNSVLNFRQIKFFQKRYNNNKRLRHF